MVFIAEGECRPRDSSSAVPCARDDTQALTSLDRDARRRQANKRSLTHDSSLFAFLNFLSSVDIFEFLV
jgi:hypothetical protein